VEKSPQFNVSPVHEHGPPAAGGLVGTTISGGTGVNVGISVAAGIGVSVAALLGVDVAEDTSSKIDAIVTVDVGIARAVCVKL